MLCVWIIVAEVIRGRTQNNWAIHGVAVLRLPSGGTLSYSRSNRLSTLGSWFPSRRRSGVPEAVERATGWGVREKNEDYGSQPNLIVSNAIHSHTWNSEQLIRAWGCSGRRVLECCELSSEERTGEPCSSYWRSFERILQSSCSQFYKWALFWASSLASSTISFSRYYLGFCSYSPTNLTAYSVKNFLRTKISVFAMSTRSGIWYTDCDRWEAKSLLHRPLYFSMRASFFSRSPRI